MDLLDLLKQTGGPGIALGVMAWMVKYFMAKLDERDKAQREVSDKIVASLERNTAAMERAAAVMERLDRMHEVSQPGIRVVSSNSAGG